MHGGDHADLRPGLPILQALLLGRGKASGAVPSTLLGAGSFLLQMEAGDRWETIQKLLGKRGKGANKPVKGKYNMHSKRLVVYYGFFKIREK